MPELSPFRSLMLMATLSACAVLAGGAAPGADPGPKPAVVDGGDAGRGAQLSGRVGCGSCHIIPGVAGANGLVGPPLDHIAGRQFLAGMLENTPDNMVLWLRFPQRVIPGNAMPDMGLSQDQARDITAYLETLR